MHAYLLKKNSLRLARPFLDAWVDELTRELDDWFTTLLMHVLEKRAARFTKLQ